ncbi:MAG TPA: tRNA (adenosine(37)-N6)-threonylcarbamoyltransferase complex dimerization subunit type 1 TsaB [Bacteroidetes bacterium]|nr:tRNA (adenosine(37)-N6)-threonylcarbamoyltransferase complex dimerization subunit type 1 TsaB [Bacteroidota bacterium]
MFHIKYLLAIETSGNICSVALYKGSECIAIKESHKVNTHSESLALFIRTIFENINISLNKLDEIAVSSGPGSYTGLRIGTSMAKGLVYGLDIPLISVSTLEAMAIAMKKGSEQNTDFNPNSLPSYTYVSSPNFIS